jgi:hypothetical protein
MKEQLSNKDGACCCEQLRDLHLEKEDKFNKIADTWKNKSYLLAGKYFKTLQNVREEHTKL